MRCLFFILLALLCLAACSDSTEEPAEPGEQLPFECAPVEIDGCVLEKDAVCSDIIMFYEDGRLECLDLRGVTCFNCLIRADKVLLDNNSSLFGFDEEDPSDRTWSGDYDQVHAPGLNLAFDTFNVSLDGNLVGCDFAERHIKGRIVGELTGCTFRNAIVDASLGGNLDNVDLRGALLLDPIYVTSAEGALWDGATCMDGYTIPEGSGEDCLERNQRIEGD